MKRLFMCSAVLAGSLFGFEAQAQQQRPAQGTAPQGTAPQGTAPRATTPQPTNPQATNPQATTPQGTTPQGTAPQQAPREVAPGAAPAAPVQGTGTQIRGQVIRSGKDGFVVRGSDNKDMTFRTNPDTRYYSNNKAGRFDDIRVGANINAWYGPGENDQYYANTVHVLPADGAATTQVPAANGTFYEGEVVRVVGNDQVVVKTSDGKEVIVYVNPQTTYRLNDQPATFNQFQPGLPIRVEYSLQNDRSIAHGIIGRRR
jgi:hypothetical protein